MFSGLVISARSPPPSRNWTTARIFGAIEPSAKWVPSARRCLQLVERHVVDPLLLGGAPVEGHLLDRRRDEQRICVRARWRAAQTPGPCRSRPRHHARLPCSSATTGMPPPPTAMTTTPASMSWRITSISTMRFGWGEATTRRQPRPASSSTSQPSSSRRRMRFGFVEEGADGLRRVQHRRIVGGNLHLGDDGRHRLGRCPSR